MKDRQLLIRIDGSMKGRLARFAQKAEITASEVVRRAIEAYIGGPQ